MSAETMAALTPLRGLWRTSGHVLDGSGRRTAEITGTDEYELMTGGQWLIHRVDVLVGGARTVALELIGDPGEDGTFAMRAFDGSGAYDEMRLSVADGGVLHLAGEGVRSTLRVDRDAMEALWERDDGVRWVPWMEMRFDRIR
ncbi:hypothetical protein GCM10011374_13730 [Kocuria dechangensis]|uniref:DUF1579 domain-containing protein n=1 Tax=Kocuria dechangensis TaxID=1176249 RepID=A0A917LR61_9MICC|nr:hypothetical protein [Kocuria dechangensis]GGG52236.1 hypothetical protein GCM10011374_13730 [Kocuria dechangensis]